MGLTGVQVGTVETVTEQGVGLSLVLRLVGWMDGRQVVQRVAIHPDNLAEFLDRVDEGARQHFPDHARSTRTRKQR
jgi:hypothetical protein